MTAGIEVVRADGRDVETVSRIIAEAFFELPPSRWLVPDEGWRRAIYARFFRLAYAEPGLATGAVYLTADRLAAAVWLHIDPDQSPGPDPVTDAAIQELTGPFHKNFAEFDRLLAEAHEPYLDRPHDFLAVLGAHPVVWRQGSGKALLKHHHRILDRIGRGAYLEAATPELVGYYRPFGYSPTDAVITLPNGVTMHPMWREPRAGDPGPAG
jgi:GNAT superfamily N-acetyltransferase